MRVPYYLAQYQHNRPQSPRRSSSVLPAIAVGGVVLLYIGTLAVLLLGGWS